MIANVFFKTQKLEDLYTLRWEKATNFCSIKLEELENNHLVEEIAFVVKFTNPIRVYRSPQYKWEKVSNKFVSLNSHSPKILVLEDGTHIVSSKNIGSWVIKDSTTIEWVLKSPYLTPLFHYNQRGERIFRKSFCTENYELGLLLTKQEVPEFSRSKLPFKPIICFTDHCDFDDYDKLSKQLEFFKENIITISKGFFLNHFSKRDENISYEKEPELVKKCQKDGHELFYHALTQSLRENEEALREFRDFVPLSGKAIRTYVDHGYQIYNLTKKQETGWSDDEWSDFVAQKGVTNFWTYLDSGTAMKGAINQLNPNHFTLFQLIKNNGFNLRRLIRTELFFCGREELLLQYRQMASLVKDFKKKKTVSKMHSLLMSIIKVSGHLFYSLLFYRNRVFKYAQFAPFVFKSNIGGKTFNFFQTVEVTNFEETFSPSNIDLLVKESGAIIAHCYFASPLSHQKGRLFRDGEITETNRSNFKYLKSIIESQKIWNPTISELIDYSNQVGELEYSWDKDRNRIIISNSNIPVRFVKHV